MAKAKSAFYCGACGFESARWLGRCPACDAWNTFTDAPVLRSPPRASRARSLSAGLPAGPVRLAEIDDRRIARIQTGMREFDACLGGGLVPGSLVLLGGPPGAGKSTLLLQIAERLSAAGAAAVYV